MHQKCKKWRVDQLSPLWKYETTQTRGKDEERKPVAQTAFFIKKIKFSKHSWICDK